MGLLARWLGKTEVDHGAFARVYDLYFQKIFNYILGRTASVTESEDLTAQTFYKALANFNKVDPAGAEPWLYRIATNEVNQFYRKKGRRPFHESPHDLGELGDRELRLAEQELEQKQLFCDLNGCLQLLKPHEQTLIALRYFEGKTYAEIAEILGKRPGGCTMSTHRALEKLKGLLAARGINHERFRETFRAHQAGFGGADLSAQAPT